MPEKDITVDGNLTDVATVTDAMRLIIIDAGTLKDVTAAVLKAYTDAITDAGGYFTATDKDGALQELGAAVGFPLQVSTYNTNPADATTYYFGGLHGAGLGTTGGGRRIYIPRAGTVTKAYLVFTCSTGSNETSTVSFRLNDTTDTTISTTVALNASPHVASKTDLSISVSAGDFFEIKWVSPTWATNPTAVSVSGVIWIE